MPRSGLSEDKVQAPPIRSVQLALLATVCDAQGDVCDPAVIHLLQVSVLPTLDGAHGSHQNLGHSHFHGIDDGIDGIKKH